MTDKEFKRLKRSQLIEIIYELQLEQQKLTEEKDAMEQRLTEEKTELQRKLTEEKEELQKQLDEQQTRIEEAGSIAEATVALSDIFDVAQKTADKYLAEVHTANMLSEQKSKELLASAQAEARELIEEAEQQSDEIRRKAKSDIEFQWSQFQKKVTDVLMSHSELKKFLDNGQRM